MLVIDVHCFYIVDAQLPVQAIASAAKLGCIALFAYVKVAAQTMTRSSRIRKLLMINDIYRMTYLLQYKIDNINMEYQLEYEYCVW